LDEQNVPLPGAKRSSNKGTTKWSTWGRTLMGIFYHFQIKKITNARWWYPIIGYVAKEITLDGSSVYNRNPCEDATGLEEVSWSLDMFSFKESV